MPRPSCPPKKGSFNAWVTVVAFARWIPWGFFLFGFSGVTVLYVDVYCPPCFSLGVILSLSFVTIAMSNHTSGGAIAPEACPCWSLSFLVLPPEAPCPERGFPGRVGLSFYYRYSFI